MSLHTEFSALKGEAFNIVERAKNDNRVMTATEKADVEQRMSRMSEIKATLAASNAIEAADVDDVDDVAAAVKRSMNTIITPSNSFAFNKPLAKDVSLFKAMGFGKQQLSLGEFMRAADMGPRNDVERFALQSGSDSVGGFDVPTDVAAKFIDGIRAQSVYMTAGATVLPMTDRWVASQVVDPTATFRAENAAVTTATPFTGVDLSPKALNVIVKVSREQLEDSVNVNAEIDRVLTEAMARAADAAIGFGAGGNEPSGIASTSGIIAVTSAANGDTVTSYAKLLEALYQLQTNNTNPNAVVMSPREAKAFNSLADTTGQPLRRPDALNALAFYSSASTPITQTQGTSSNASTILVGDASRLLIGMRVGLRIEVLKELYAANHQYGFSASIRFDSLATRAKSFAKISGLIPA